MGPAADQPCQLAIDTATEAPVSSGLEVHEIVLAVIRLSGAIARLVLIAHPGAPPLAGCPPRTRSRLRPNPRLVAPFLRETPSAGSRFVLSILPVSRQLPTIRDRRSRTAASPPSYQEQVLPAAAGIDLAAGPVACNNGAVGAGRKLRAIHKVAFGRRAWHKLTGPLWLGRHVFPASVACQAQPLKEANRCVSLRLGRGGFGSIRRRRRSMKGMPSFTSPARTERRAI